MTGTARLLKRIEERIGGKDAIQIVAFAAHVRRIMAENPDLKIISVLLKV